MKGSDFKEITCYSVMSYFHCSRCSSKTSHVEGIASSRKEIKWLCVDCYKAALGKELEEDGLE